jgi:sterol desaturase/sphingolipid hydroxylase (fatty acid hydroxylase superfamily)
MTQDALQLLHQSTPTPSLLGLVIGLAVGAVILFPLERRFGVEKLPLWRRGLLLDVAYWFFAPLFTRVFTTWVLGLVLVVALVVSGRAVDGSVLDGYGPVARLPLWVQIILILLIVDFVDYWTHRAFHTSWMWRFHAIHHSAEVMSWLCSGRMHPVNDAVTRTFQIVPLVLLGFSIQGALIIVPFLFVYVILLHSNLNWDFGPLRYVLVSPAYHRWHHTSDDDGVDVNFAAIFPMWDVLFGTCYFPRGRTPEKFGVRHDPVPETLWGHLVYPFRSPAGGRRPAPPTVDVGTLSSHAP